MERGHALTVLNADIGLDAVCGRLLTTFIRQKCQTALSLDRRAVSYTHLTLPTNREV